MEVEVLLRLILRKKLSFPCSASSRPIKRSESEKLRVLES